MTAVQYLKVNMVTTAVGVQIPLYNIVGTHFPFFVSHDNPQSPTFSPNDGESLIMSPNPATDWLNVRVQLRGGGKPGQSTIDVYHANGRPVLSCLVADASSFQLEVASLPAGIYRMVLQTEVGRLDGTFPNNNTGSCLKMK